MAREPLAVSYHPLLQATRNSACETIPSLFVSGALEVAHVTFGL